MKNDGSDKDGSADSQRKEREAYQELQEEQTQSLESDQESDCECEPHPEFEGFMNSIRLDELCAAASNLRNGVPCRVSDNTVGGK
jgi:hypothetical protein